MRTFLLDQENILYLISLSILIACLLDNVRVLYYYYYYYYYIIIIIIIGRSYILIISGS